MYLVDTSVWVDFFREKQTAAVLAFEEILDAEISYGITGVIYQEILQGAGSLQDYEQLNEYLSSLYFFHPRPALLSYRAAAKIYFDCRRQGITIRSSIDCLIAQIALENKLILLHDDRDFIAMQKVIPLKMWQQSNQVGV